MRRSRSELREKRAEIVKIEERVLAKEVEIDGKLTEFERREQGARRSGDAPEGDAG